VVRIDQDQAREKATCAPPLARSAIPSCPGLSTETGFQLPEELEDSTIGLSRQVTVVLDESPPPSDRGFPRQVTVDKSAYPKGLPTVSQAHRPRWVGGGSYQVIVD
jgi:hypothetical protein